MSRHLSLTMSSGESMFYPSPATPIQWVRQHLLNPFLLMLGLRFFDSDS